MILSGLQLSVFVFSALLSSVLSPLFIRLSQRTAFLDYPGERKNHERPTPCLGGAVVFISFWTTILLAFISAILLRSQLSELGHVASIITGSFTLIPKLSLIFTGGFIILAIGLFDDRLTLSPWIKLVGQSLAAVLLLSADLTIQLFQASGFFGYLITFAWILLMLNAFNFIDSLDGHCAGIALVSSMVFFWLVQIINQPVVAFFIIIFAGALFGFMPFNFKPARMFLGDNGSLFIGYVLAAVTLLCTYQSSRQLFITSMIPLFMFGIPIYDTLSVLAVRLIRGTAPWKGDRNHFAHRLSRLGMSDKIAVVFSYFTAFTLGLVSILATQIQSTLGAIVISVLFMFILGIVASLEYYAATRIRIIEELQRQKKRRREDIKEEEEKRF